MALKITRAEQPLTIKNLVVCIYAQPGVGKTSTAFTSSRPLLFDFDNGAYRAANRKDAVEVSDWKDVAVIKEDDLKDYDTVVIDTAGRCLDVLSIDILMRNPKALNRATGGLSLQGFGQLKAEFTSWLKMLKCFGKDIVLIAHMDEKQQNDDIVERLDIVGSSKNEIYKVSDAMGRLRIIDSKRALDFSPSSTGFGKNPAQLPVLQVPSFSEEPLFLGGVIQSIKDGINAQTEEQKAYLKRIDESIRQLDVLEDLSSFNEALTAYKDAEQEVKRALIKKAEEKGFSFDKETKLFVKKQGEQAA